ncbi:hypothetical protein [uncultured Flavobacterium sp.]|uniref:hypothetical protein n=1 Tax=uncultured Flavobacterium sp. TaxID=165435 RepID=UPI0030EF4390
MRKALIILFGIILCSVLTVGLFFFYSISSIDIASKKQIVKIAFPELNEQLFFEANVWGISGNHEEIILTNHKVEENPTLRKDNNYIFYTSSVFYKKEKNKLIIYCPESGISIPKNNSYKVEIKIISLKNYNEIKEYDENYKKYGLTKISAL